MARPITRPTIGPMEWPYSRPRYIKRERSWLVASQAHNPLVRPVVVPSHRSRVDKMFPPSRRQLAHRSSLNLSKQDIPEDRVQFRISMPDDELSNLKGDFLMIIDELPSTPLRLRPTSPLASPTRANANDAPLKFVAHGSHSELEDNVYQIRFFEADPNTGYVQDEAGFATVEWYVVRGEGEREKSMSGMERGVNESRWMERRECRSMSCVRSLGQHHNWLMAAGLASCAARRY